MATPGAVEVTDVTGVEPRPGPRISSNSLWREYLPPSE
jgi:hypothetical protein